MADDADVLNMMNTTGSQGLRPAATRTPRRDRSVEPFIAAWPGDCSDCGDPFDEGDDIAYVDNQIVCRDCWDEAGE
jgi:hypothetical protein